MANEVVEQEPGRPVVLDAVVEVPAEDALPALLMGVARDLAGLQEQQESSRQVGVRVGVQADTLYQQAAVEGDAEHRLSAGRLPFGAEDGCGGFHAGADRCVVGVEWLGGK